MLNWQDGQKLLFLFLYHQSLADDLQQDLDCEEYGFSQILHDDLLTRYSTLKIAYEAVLKYHKTQADNFRKSWNDYFSANLLKYLDDEANIEIVQTFERDIYKDTGNITKLGTEPESYLDLDFKQFLTKKRNEAQKIIRLCELFKL